MGGLVTMQLMVPAYAKDHTLGAIEGQSVAFFHYGSRLSVLDQKKRFAFDDLTLGLKPPSPIDRSGFAIDIGSTIFRATSIPSNSEGGRGIRILYEALRRG